MIDGKAKAIPSPDVGRSPLGIASGGEVLICDLCGEDAIMSGGDRDLALCPAHLALYYPDLAALHTAISAVKRMVRRRRNGRLN